ncbi:lantibiotic dehydratase family protein [Maribacter sp. 2-571]|uniref:lantibiotic dehydratase family protein n=1 Tax=Maribacter sp. 2-571 TaxID=3417569 RepID=UPI003D33F356
MKTTIPYKTFPNYLLRTPLLPINFLKDLTSETNICEDKLKKICEDPIISEALFLASPDLHKEIHKWLNNKLTELKDVIKLKQSVLKYLIRMSSRCTPFGLFAGCSVGQITEHTKIELKEVTQNKRYTKLDMNFLVALSQDLVSIPRVKEQILFFPNTSVYKIGDQLRYVEYNYLNGKRMHRISAVNNSFYLDKVLEIAEEGALLNTLASSIVEDGISFEEAKDFINELVENQLLISDLEPSLSGPEFLEQICSVLSTLDDVNEIHEVLVNANKKLVEIDSIIGNDSKVYLELFEDLKKLGGDYNLKFMFQTDLVLQINENSISTAVSDSINKGLVLLNKISLSRVNTVLDKFIKRFSDRYGEKEIPLSIALDVEIGLGFKQNLESGDVSPLIDDLVLPNPVFQENKEVVVSTIDVILRKRLFQALKDNEYVVSLNEKMFEDLDATWNDLPDTFSCKLEMFKINNNEKIKLNYLGGSSAANLLGRFCHGDDAILMHTRNIVNVEERINFDKILAEIVHLPESRVGNILMRPTFRKYEIPYLSKSVKLKDEQLSINDLMISVKAGKRLILRSRKENKEVIPRLTNAHNFSSDTLPIYNFLCDIQTSGVKRHIGFDWGAFADDYEFLPRVEYENLVLEEARWNLSKKCIEPLNSSIEEKDILISEIAAFRKKYRLPQYVLIGHRDNLLVINFNNLDSVSLFLNIANKKSKFSLTEFLFAEDSATKRNGQYFSNQIIMSYFNDDKLRKNKAENG